MFFIGVTVIDRGVIAVVVNGDREVFWSTVSEDAMHNEIQYRRMQQYLQYRSGKLFYTPLNFS